MSSGSKIGDSSQVGSSYSVEEESHPQEMSAEAHQTADAEKAIEEKPAEDQSKQVEHLAGSFPQTAGKAESEPPIRRIPQELVGEIVRHTTLNDRKALRLTNKLFRPEVDASINAIKVTNAHDLPEARSTFKQAKHLTLKGGELNDGHIHPELLENLRSVSFLHTSGLTGGAVANLPRGLKNQRIFNAPNVNDEGLENLPPDLEVFSSTASGITDAGIAKIPRGVKAMALAGISTGITFSDAAVRNLPPDVKRLLLMEVNITDRGVADMPKKLEELELMSPYITGAAIRNVPKSVHTLSLPMCRNVDAGIDDLSPNVHTLTVPVGGSDGISDGAIAKLPKTVKTLHLVGDNIPPERLQQLREKHKELTITLESRITLINPRGLEKARYFE